MLLDFSARFAESLELRNCTARRFDKPHHRDGLVRRGSSLVVVACLVFGRRHGLAARRAHVVVEVDADEAKEVVERHLDRDLVALVVAVVIEAVDSRDGRLSDGSVVRFAASSVGRSRAGFHSRVERIVVGGGTGQVRQHGGDDGGATSAAFRARHLGRGGRRCRGKGVSVGSVETDAAQRLALTGEDAGHRGFGLGGRRRAGCTCETALLRLYSSCGRVLVRRRCNSANDGTAERARVGLQCCTVDVTLRRQGATHALRRRVRGRLKPSQATAERLTETTGRLRRGLEWARRAIAERLCRSDDGLGG